MDIDILIGNRDKSILVNTIINYLKSKKKYIKFYEGRESTFENISVKDFNDKNTSAEYVKRILSSSYKTEELYVFEIKNIRGIKYYFVFVKFYDIVVYKKELFGINITKNPYIRAERLKDLLAYHGDLVFIKN